MKPIAILAAALAMGACANSTASFGETIHSTDIYPKYSFQYASIVAGAGGAIEVYGLPPRTGRAQRPWLMQSVFRSILDQVPQKRWNQAWTVTASRLYLRQNRT